MWRDHGEMGPALGAEMVARGRPASGWDLSADSSLPVTDPHVPAHDHVHEVGAAHLSS